MVRSIYPARAADQTEVTVMVRNVSLVDVTIVEMRALWELQSDQDCKAVVENPPGGDFGVPQIGFHLGAERAPRAKKLSGYQVGDEDWFGGRQDIALKPDQQVQPWPALDDLLAQMLSRHTGRPPRDIRSLIPDTNRAEGDRINDD